MRLEEWTRGQYGIVWKALRATHDYSRAACGATVVVALLVFGAVTAVLVR